MSNIKYSFSRLENFNNCKRGYYYTYIQKIRGGENIYSYLGTIAHEIVQDIIENKETKENGVIRFTNAVEEADMLGLVWISDKVKQNYTECVTHFIENFTPLQNDTIHIEDYMEVNIDGIILRGYIDLWYILNDTLYIVDLKTSSKFSKLDLIHKQRQLLLYALALKEKYINYKIKLQFNMLKYATTTKGKLLERNKLDLFDEYTDGVIEVDFSDELVLDLKQYVIETVREIESMDKNKSQWTKSYNPNADFFCRNLCSHLELCTKK